MTGLRRLFQSVREGRRKQPSDAVIRKLPEQAIEIGRIETRARRIVHQHPVVRGCTVGERLEPSRHRIAARRTTDGSPDLWRESARSLPVVVVGGDDHHDSDAALIAEERRERPFDHRSPVQRRVLLRQLLAETLAGTRGGHDEPVPHRTLRSRCGYRAAVRVGGASAAAGEGGTT